MLSDKPSINVLIKSFSLYFLGEDTSSTIFALSYTCSVLFISSSLIVLIVMFSHFLLISSSSGDTYPSLEMYVIGFSSSTFPHILLSTTCSFSGICSFTGSSTSLSSSPSSSPSSLFALLFSFNNVMISKLLISSRNIFFISDVSFRFCIS